MKKLYIYLLLFLFLAGPWLGSFYFDSNLTISPLQTFSLHDKGVNSDGIIFASEESPSAETTIPYHLSEIGADDISNTLAQYDTNETIVAIIDTGAELSHEDLSDNIWINEKEKNGIENVDDDNNGYVDDVYGLDLIHKGEYLTSLPTADPVSGITPPKYDIPEDDSDTSHGTHVSGIVGMNPNNLTGYAGVGYKTKIMILKAGSSNNSFNFNNCIEAVKYAVDNGADVINMSFGSTKQSDLFATALEEAADSCLLVAAAGNSATASSDAPVYPASYPYIIGVMASNATTGDLWTSSNWNDTTPACYDIICPGESILSTSRYNLYESKSGTSMASPMVAGSAAVIMGFLEANKEYNTREELLNDTKKYLFMSDSTFTYTTDDNEDFVSPRLNLKQSLLHAIADIKAEEINPSPTFTPTATPTSASTIAPSATPTLMPTMKPTGTPTLDPTIKPTDTPTLAPTPKLTAPPIPTPTPTIAPISTLPVTEPFSPVTNTTTSANITLKGTSKNGTSIVLKWTQSLSPRNYTIYRSTKKNQLGKKLAVVTNRHSFIDRKIACGKTYYYRITSDGVMSKPLKVFLPKKLHITSLQQIGKKRWKLKWKGTKHITRYQIKVYRPDTGITNWYYTKKKHITLRIPKKATVQIRAQVIHSSGNFSGKFSKRSIHKK